MLPSVSPDPMHPFPSPNPDPKQKKRDDSHSAEWWFGVSIWIHPVYKYTKEKTKKYSNRVSQKKSLYKQLVFPLSGPQTQFNYPP